MTQDDSEQFRKEVEERVLSNGRDQQLLSVSNQFHNEINRVQYGYNFSWLGVPIFQIPQDLAALQEIIWSVQPEVIIETGIARGGSLIFSASMLKILGRGQVIGVDIDIRSHNRKVIESHPLSSVITMIEGSSTDQQIIDEVKKLIQGRGPVLVSLDSNHTHEHVLAELRAYADLVSPGSYCIVFDTGIEDLPEELTSHRPWGPGNSPKSAIREFLQERDDFQVDQSIENKILVTAASGGFLRRSLSSN